MNCAETEKYLSEYLDNEIAPHLRQQIDEHLAQCESCRHKLAQIQALCSSIASLNEELPEDFNAKLAARLAVAKKAQTPNRPLYKKVWFRVSSLAACLLICLGAVGLLTGPGHDGAYEEANDLAAPQLAESSLNKSLAADDAANNMLSQYGMSEDEASTADPQTDTAVNEEAVGAAEPAAADEDIAAGSAHSDGSNWFNKVWPWLLGIVIIIFVVGIVLRSRRKNSKI